MHTFAYKHIKMVTQCPTTTHTRHQSRDQPINGTQRAHTTLLRGSAISTAIAAICRQSQPVTADAGGDSKRQSTEALSRASAAATGCMLQQRAEKPAAEPGHRLRWPMRGCAGHAPLMHRRRGGGQRRQGTRRPLNGSEPSTPQTLIGESVSGFPHSGSGGGRRESSGHGEVDFAKTGLLKVRVRNSN